MQETRRYKVLEHLLPALTTGDATAFEEGDEDDRLLDRIGDELEIDLDGGNWAITAEVVDIDEFATPSVGPRGQVATVIITRPITFPAHVFVGYYDGDEYVCTEIDGRVCATEEEAQRYVHERQAVVIDEARCDLAGDLYDGLRDCIECIEDQTAPREAWPPEDVHDLLGEVKEVEKAYRLAMSTVQWEIGTDGGS